MFFGEEYAWRGCLQGRLQNIFGKRMGVILLGIIWELWHMPLWFQISEPGQGKLIVLLVLMRMPYVIALAVFLDGHI
ncbi:MAG: CPBP family intramembrane glutamic endopeptidase [Dorea longicatena]